MRVLMVTREHPPYAWGGMSMVCDALEKLLPDHDIDLTIIAPAFSCDLVAHHNHKVTMYRVPIFGNSFLTKIPSFSYFASRLVAQIQNGFDVIYSHSTPIYCKLNRPLVVHFHGTRLGEYTACCQGGKFLEAYCNRAYVFFDRWLVKKADLVVVLTEAMKAQVESLQIPGKNIQIIPNGVDASTFKPLHGRRFNQLVKKILYVGRLDARKGLDVLIDAVHKLNNIHEIDLIFAGEGREEKRLREKSRELGVHVDFRGKVGHESLPDLYNEADLFVLPSLYEGFPLVLLEAIASGTPSISSTASPSIGVPRFAAGDSDALTAILNDILAEPEKMESLARNCYEISRHYSWQEVVKSIKLMLHAVIDQ